ncbi:MAG: hypothetical protein BGO99_05220 [Nitrosospira sp. 56-18]|jgi:hypothetical protein|nr:nucleotide-binding protein [Nitrosospira sp.]OJY14765.1 MAG: hypothetical protein BGO99_05220 [Nitrosospira sp. 56-18]
MRRTIFYSWQSDLDGVGNRNFIEEALKRALKSIKKDESETIEPVLDRDTAGLSGSPSITESIFEKIALADVFVADVSIINKDSDERHTPNPNILVELGYAVAQLGWNRILLVQNTVFGGPEELPFDLRGRRVIPYIFGEKSGNRSEARGLLQGRLEAGLRAVIDSSNYISLPAGLDVSLWWGKWAIEDSDQAHGGQLFIREVAAAGFLFDLSVFNGAHMGFLTSYACIVSSDVAYARVPNGNNGEIGEVVFRREIYNSRRTIKVNETASCSYYRGARVVFAGEFARKRDALFDHGVLNELELARLYSISGEYFDSLSQRFQQLNEVKNDDDFHAKVIRGGVRGLYTIMEGIVMLGMTGELWVAYIDDDVIRYFTTQVKWKNVLPKTVDNWRERFKDKRILFHSCVDIVPKDNRFAHE